MKSLSSSLLFSCIAFFTSHSVSYGQIYPPNSDNEKVVTEDTLSNDVERHNPELFEIDRFYNDNTKEVGNTPARSSVSATGAAIYDIPIAIPKGNGDFAPSVSLTYNSQTGNGIAGFGFNVTGISVITRGAKDIFHDGTAQGIRYQADDAYYLDGKRLILSSGTAGVNGAVYAPEGDALTHITLHNSSGDVWFEAVTTDGMYYEYGRTSASRQNFTYNSSTIANAWYVSKAENPVGLTVTYTYLTDHYFLYPQCISYGTGNTINFEYQNRYDVQPFILGSTKGSMSLRLRKIKSKYNNVIYRQYLLEYFTDKFARLCSVTEQDASGNSIHPIQLSWNEIENFSPQVGSVSASLAEPESYEEFSERSFLSSDMNGDGRSDIIQISPVKVYTTIGYNTEFTYETYAYISRSTSSGTYSAPIKCVFAGNYDFEGWSSKSCSPIVRDFDGDGINDLVIPNTLNSNMNAFESFKLEYVYGKDIADATYTATVYSKYITSHESVYDAADFDNDGKCNIVVMEKTATSGTYPLYLLTSSGNTFTHVTGSITLPSAPQRLFAADFNHDGLTDIMAVYSSGYKIFWNRSGQVSSTTFSDTYSTTGTNIYNYTTLELGDFNGDGVADFLMNANNNATIYFAIGNGDGSFTINAACSISEFSNPILGSRGCYIFDFDRDGKTDVIFNQLIRSSSFEIKALTHWLRSTGTALTTHKTASSIVFADGQAGHAFVGDFRGVGYPELMNYGNDCYNGVNANGTAQLRLYQMGDASDGKVNAVRGSLGNLTYFRYAPLTNTEVYTKGTGCTYPLLDVSAPLCVTTWHQEQGRSSSYWNSYTYSGLKGHMQGRGLIGFNQITVKHNNSTTITTTMSGWNNNTFLVPTHTLKTTSVDEYTSTTETSMSLKTFNNNFKLYPATLVETDIYNHQNTTTYTYDQDHGYLQQERTTYDGNSMYRQTSYSDYTYTGRAYRPQTITSTQKHEDDNSVYTSITQLTYNSNGLPASKTDFYGTPKSLTHSYAYDGYGNVLSETLSGNDISSVTHYYQYSSDGKHLTTSYTSPSAITMQYSYDSYGNLQYETDITDPSASKIIKRHFYDGLGRTTSYGSLNDFSPVVSRGWGDNVYEKSYTLERCQSYPWKKTWYDTDGRVSKTETIGPKGIPVVFQEHCNGYGQPTYRYYRNGTISSDESLTYDALNRLQTDVFSSGKSISYSYGDRTVTRVENGRSYTTTYDAWGNVTSSSDPESSVTYTYYSNGKPHTVSSEGNTITMTYDMAGNQTSLADPDAGTVTYEYDALRRLKQQTDARGIVTTYTYDAADRLIQKTIDGIATTYTYGTSGHGTNCLTSMQTGDRSIAYSYNNSRKVVGETRTMSGEPSLSFVYEYDYDDLVYTIYPNGFWIQNNKDGFGYTHAVNLDDGSNVWYLDSSDGQDDLIKIGGTLNYADDPYADDPEMQNDPIYSFYAQEFLDVPDPVMTRTVHRDNKGFPASYTLNCGNTTVSQLTFSHDPITGNLLSRFGMISQQETFSYDNLDRLTGVTVGNTPTMAMQYDDNGNIASKTGLGNYYYPSSSTRPHAVTAVDNTSALVSTNSQQITYNALGKVATITEGNYTMEFTYGPDEQRWKSVLKHNGVIVRKTLYAGNYERVIEGSTTRHYCYLEGGAVNISEGNDDGTTYIMVTDNLGSIIKLVDIDGNTDFEASYDAWGKQTVASGNAISFHRGYTGHEMMPEFGLINMNGRLYDPILARFLSPDNYIQMPDFSQSFNRYSYCLNNPLKYTDPDGEFAWLALGLAIVGGYFGGVVTNQGELNPLSWDYSDPLTYLGVGIGAISGGITGSFLGGSTSWGLSFMAESTYLSAGITLSSTAASGLKYGFHWTTAAGGGYDSGVEQAVKKAGQAVDKFIDESKQYMNNVHTGLDVIGLVPGLDFADLLNSGLYLIEGDYSNAGISAAAMVPFFGAIATSGKNAKNAAEILSKYGSKYTNSSLKHGQEIHKMYKVNDLGNDMIKEYRGIKGCRPDFVDFQNYIIYELKPYNPQGVRNGIKQLERYKRLFELKTGATWDTFIDFY